jgi:hypothetical protein
MAPVDISLNKAKYRTPKPKGGNKSTGGNSGINKHRGEIRPEVKRAAQQATQHNMPTLVLAGGRRRIWQRPGR